MVKQADRNTGVVSSIPPCVTFKTPLVRKATGNHLMNSSSQAKLRALPLVSATLEIEYATQVHFNELKAVVISACSFGNTISHMVVKGFYARYEHVALSYQLRCAIELKRLFVVLKPFYATFISGIMAGAPCEGRPEFRCRFW